MLECISNLDDCHKWYIFCKYFMKPFQANITLVSCLCSIILSKHSMQIQLLFPAVLSANFKTLVLFISTSEWVMLQRVKMLFFAPKNCFSSFASFSIILMQKREESTTANHWFIPECWPNNHWKCFMCLISADFQLRLLYVHYLSEKVYLHIWEF